MDIRKEQEVWAPAFGFGGRRDVFNAGAPAARYGCIRKPDSGSRCTPGKITIAIADDCAIQHKIWRLLIRDHIALELVCQAFNGQDLIRQIETLALLPDICILDLEMPVMNGICTAKRLSQRFPTIMLFGYTSCEDDFMKKEMLKHNVITVFSKTENRVLLHTISHLRNPAIATTVSATLAIQNNGAYSNPG